MNIKLFDSKFTLKFSDDWVIRGKIPDFPETSTIIQKDTSNSINMVVMYPFEKSKAMPFDNIDVIIKNEHNQLFEDQGLIEVNTGKENFKYVYVIIKELRENGNQYILNLHCEIKNKYYCIIGFFQENGITGTRETTVFEQCRRNNLVTIDERTNKINGWNYDPYDENYKQGHLMNLSEQKSLDEYFPNHPLSQCRLFIKEFLENKI